MFPNVYTHFKRSTPLVEVSRSEKSQLQSVRSQKQSSQQSMNLYLKAASSVKSSTSVSTKSVMSTAHRQVSQVFRNTVLKTKG